MTTNEKLVELKVAAVSGAANLPLIAAIENGLFASEGLEIALTLSPTPAIPLASLASGELDIVYSDFDALISFNAGVRALDDGEESDLRAFMGGTCADLSLVAAPDVESYEDFRDRSLALDGLTTGYSFVLYEMLARAGLRQSDFKMVTVGPAADRWQAVRDGEHAGMLATEPYTSIARAAGYRILDRSVDVIGPLQARITAARRTWIQDNGETAGRYVRGFLAGLAWSRVPANRAAAAGLVMAGVPEIGIEMVESVLISLLAPETGFAPNAALVDEGIETVLILRERYGGHANTLSSASDYVDLSLYESIVGAPS